MERQAAAAGARFEVREGWNVAVTYPGPRPKTAWADVSHLPKHFRDGPHDLELGRAVGKDGAWWCPVSDRRAVVIGGESEPEFGFNSGFGGTGFARAGGTGFASLGFAGLTVLGPQARELIARFCAIDLRPRSAPPSSFRPGSIARQPGMILCEGEDRYMLLFGWAIAQYMWTVVEDAGSHLGARPIGIDQLDA